MQHPSERRDAGAPTALQVVRIDGTAGVNLRPIFANVSDHPDNRNPRFITIHVAHVDAFANRILVGKHFVRHVAADDRYLRCTRAIGVIKQAPSNQRNAQCLEIALAGKAVARPVVT